MSTLTPREIVSELNRYIVGQNAAKKIVAVALRNRWRRKQVPASLRDEIAPKNILMIGPTGVGKTEIVRRLAKLASSPTCKVEATKFTEVGYVGRDVESIVRDLMEVGVNIVKKEESEKVKLKAETIAEERILDLLLPPSPKEKDENNTRQQFRQMLRNGKFDTKIVEMEVSSAQPNISMVGMPGMDGMDNQMQDMFGKIFPKQKKWRKITVIEAYEIILQEESERLVDMDKVIKSAKERVEQSGIIFIDEIDKVCGGHDRGGAGVSREGVQRDLLPIVEGCTVNTKYGAISTDHILFIAAGAFHTAKPSDLVPELQGRFPLRVELSALNKEDFYLILTEPEHALTIQYKALFKAEGLEIEFSKDALEEIAEFAQQVNTDTENIGARRLYTIMEKVLMDLSFSAPELTQKQIIIDREYVCEKLKELRAHQDLSRYIL